MSKILTITASEKRFYELKDAFRGMERILLQAKDQIPTIVQNDKEVSTDDLVEFINNYQQTRNKLRDEFEAMMAALDTSYKRIILEIKKENDML